MAGSVPFFETICHFPQSVSQDPSRIRNERFMGPASWRDFEVVKRHIPTNEAMDGLLHAGMEALMFEQSLKQAPQKIDDAMTAVLEQSTLGNEYQASRPDNPVDALAGRLEMMSVQIDLNSELVLEWPKLWQALDKARQPYLEHCKNRYMLMRGALDKPVILEMAVSQPSQLATWVRGRLDHQPTTSLLMLHRMRDRTRVPAMAEVLSRLAEEAPAGQRIRVTGRVNYQDVTLCAIVSRGIEWTVEGEVQRRLEDSDGVSGWVDQDESLASAIRS